MNEKKMIPTVLSQQSNLDQAKNKVLEEIRELNDAFSKLESELLVAKQVNSLPSSRLASG